MARTNHPDSTFEYTFSISRGASDDWFDPQLHADTQLFVDPFLMFDETTAPWKDAQDRIIDFFNTAMEHLALSGGKKTSIEWKRAAAMFSFPEPPEFCLGFGHKTIFGSGSAAGLGKAMLEAGEQAIRAGMTNIDDFGELLLFGEGFGRDRISDMVCNIIKDDFVGYTDQVVQHHSIPTTTVKLRHNGFDFSKDRWRATKVALPINPCWSQKTGVLLVPERFLDELPKMDDVAFWDWVYNNQNEQPRNDLGYTVTKGLKKKQILALAKRRATLRYKFGRRYAAAQRAKPPKPYDLAADPSNKVTARRGGQNAARAMTVATPENEGEFCSFVTELVVQFKDAIENRGIWKSMWNKQNPRDEAIAQDLFHIAVLNTCRLHDIDLSPEANAGQGAVDFKFSAGWKRRALVETKLAKSSSFWDNLEEQAPAYLKAEGIECGYFVVIQHYDSHCEEAFLTRVEEIVARVSKDAGRTYEVIFIDARPKASASKLKRKKPPSK